MLLLSFRRFDIRGFILTEPKQSETARKFSRRRTFPLAQIAGEPSGGATLQTVKSYLVRLPSRVYTLLLLVLLVVTPARAQKNTSNETVLPKYDSHTETKTKGVVDEVKEFPLANKREITELMVKSGNDTFRVFLCPKSFQDEMGVSFSKGDEISLTGSKVKLEDADVILGKEVVKGNDTLLLRDDKGNPVWTWHSK